MTWDSILLVRSAYAIYRSDDLGQSWSRANLVTYQMFVSDIDVADGIFYAAIGYWPSENHASILWSNDTGMTFETLYGSIQDPISSIDFEPNIDWFPARKWGNVRGANTIDYNGVNTYINGDLPFEFQGELRRIVIDRLEPRNVAYTYGIRGDPIRKRSFRTVDGGKNWLDIDYLVIYAGPLQADVLALAKTHYSTNRGAS